MVLPRLSVLLFLALPVALLGDAARTAPTRWELDGLAVSFAADGVLAIEAHDEGESIAATLQVVRVGRDETTPSTAPRAQDRNEVSYLRGPGVVEWYRRDPRGLEQGFTLERRAPGAGPVVVDVAVSGDLIATADEARHRVVLQSPQGRTVLAYGELSVVGADGRAVPASLEVAGTHVRLLVDDQDAKYPLVVDPLVWREHQQWVASDAAANARFGTAIAIDGPTAVVGALYASGGGAAYFFERSSVATWSQSQRFNASDAPEAGGTPQFGGAVAIQGNTAVIGARYSGGEKGAAYVFTRAPGGPWSETQKLVPADPGLRDGFGNSVAIDGDTIVIGANLKQMSGLNDAGAAYVFVRSGATWIQQGGALTETVVAAYANFGAAVAVHGDWALVGTSSLQGAPGVYAFHRTGTTWATPAQYIPAPAGALLIGAALSMTGTTFVTASFGEPTTTSRVYVFVLSGSTWVPQADFIPSDSTPGDSFGMALTIDGDRVLASSPFKGGGTAYTFVRTGSSWAQEAKLTPSVGTAVDRFGSATALSQDTLLVGANERNAMAGSVFHFTRQLPEGDACTGAGQCHSGFCVDGVCCNTTCGGGAADDCLSCAGSTPGTQAGTCGPAATTVVCRTSRPACDVEEHCDGVAMSCPADLTLPNGAACASGTCVAGACKPFASTPDAGTPADAAAAPSDPGGDSGCSISPTAALAASSTNGAWLLFLAGLGSTFAARRSSRRRGRNVLS